VKMVEGFPAPAPMSCKGVELVPILLREAELLHRIAIEPAVSTRVRWHGATPTLGQFLEAIGDGVLAQYAIIDDLDEVRGAVVLSSPNHIEGHCHFSVFTDPAVRGQDVGFRASLLTLQYAFSSWPFRKIYMEVMDRNIQPHWHIDADFLVEEGRLREHSFFEGAFHDTVIFAIWRERFREVAVPVILDLCGEEIS
jgi:RimJ/RimL family protein N-acetyltransferase